MVWEVSEEVIWLVLEVSESLRSNKHNTGDT